MQRAVKPKKANLPKKVMRKEPKSELSPALDKTIKRIMEGKEKLTRYTFDEYIQHVKKVLEE